MDIGWVREMASSWREVQTVARERTPEENERHESCGSNAVHVEYSYCPVEQTFTHGRCVEKARVTSTNAAGRMSTMVTSISIFRMLIFLFLVLFFAVSTP
jgi:hypothetical protein